ncbi:NHL repeat-containing protein [Mucilaginibacter psychrotolerans]|nr:NHL repeat-containing protein [Mucilaginibacter psychrotolerans]
MKSKFTLPSIFSIILITMLSACLKSSDTDTAPTIVTSPVIVNAAGTGAFSGGFITSGTATAYGVCYSSSNQVPTVSDTKTSETVNYGTYASSITDLTPNTTYYLRAYATYLGTTAYGAVVQFNTGSDQSTTTGQVSTFAGAIAGGFLDGIGTAALFQNPMGIATDAAGTVYVADSFNSAIRKITTDGHVTTLAGNGSLGFIDGTAETAKFYSPSGLAVDAAGNVYVADLGNNAIRKVTPTGTVTTLAGSGDAGYADGTGSAATFNTPRGVAVDANGNVYVADYGNNLIRKITAAGVVTTIAGSRTTGYANGTGTDANFNKPTGITLDATGNIYVAEPLNNAIRKIDADMLVTTFAGGSTSGTTITALLGAPNSLSIDGSGNFWICDGNRRIIKIGTDKKLIVMAGASGGSGYTDGAGTAALFNGPTGIAVGTGGNIYVADFGNNVIRKIN